MKKMLADRGRRSFLKWEILERIQFMMINRNLQRDLPLANPVISSTTIYGRNGSYCGENIWPTCSGGHQALRKFFLYSCLWIADIGITAALMIRLHKKAMQRKKLLNQARQRLKNMLTMEMENRD